MNVRNFCLLLWGKCFGRTSEKLLSELKRNSRTEAKRIASPLILQHAINRLATAALVDG